jgi:ABC-type uncharacterized transport system permease subunit
MEYDIFFQPGLVLFNRISKHLSNKNKEYRRNFFNILSSTDTMKKSRFITLNFSLDRSSSHRAWTITDIAVLVGNFTDTSIRRVVEGLKVVGAVSLRRSINTFLQGPW